MNAGCFRPVRMVVPEGSMLRPAYPAAVVAGNVEVSQAVTDALFGATGALGSSQGGMNNLTFGDDRRQYYETIASGAPAGPGFDGAEAVQVHMTNSRLTDPEILETALPRGAGGFPHPRRLGRRGPLARGRRREPHLAVPRADGVRDPVFLPQDPALRLQGRRAGRDRGPTVRRADGRIEPLGGCAQTVLEPGEAVTIVTPTGGGYGEARLRTTDA